MNKRISELVDQVANDMPGVYNIEYESGNKGVEFTEQSLEKFAELILQDIDKIVDDLYHSMPLEQAAVLLTLDENIKEHFYGVEE